MRVYLEHFNLHEEPFALTPSTRFLYFTEAHREALDHLLFGIRQRKGFMVLVGEVGAGKTTLCRALLHELDGSYQTALILNPMLTETQLLRLILIELGMPNPRGDKLVLREKLNTYLLAQNAAGNTVVLIVDEAQNLSREMLENIRLLSNLETESAKLLQIVLIGQPELRDMLSDHRLRQLRQRVAVYARLGPIPEAALPGYVQHRLRVAGANGTPRFDADAMALLGAFAAGIPRRINAACDMALLSAYGQGQRQVGRSEMQSAIEELQGVCQ